MGLDYIWGKWPCPPTPRLAGWQCFKYYIEMINATF